jgi:hypothetical protein
MRRTHTMILAVTLLVGCLGEQPPRNTVQHGVIAKEDLVGVDGTTVWYYLQTVADVPYATGFTFAGEQSNLEKVRWDIQEKVLYARRAYEWLRGGEESATSAPEQGGDPKKFLGAPIAAFAVEKHFDIIRDYNTATGEEINKIVENDTDRKWWERKFMRVDWSRNLLPSFEFLARYDETAVNPLKQEAIPYYVSDPDDPNAMRIRRPAATTADPRPTADYLDITSKLMVTPEMTTLVDETGSYTMPACFLAEDNGPDFASTDCSAQEITIRHSFMRANQRDYDPLIYDDRWMERFGYFSTERQSFDKQYAETETGRVRLANRFNLWQKTLSDTPCALKDYYKAGIDAVKARDDARKAADAMCAAKVGASSECAYLVGQCTLPPKDRGGVRKIVYYLNVGFPDALLPSAQETVNTWNDVFQTTAARLLNPGDDPKDSKLLAQRKQEVGTIFELRANDCSEASVNAYLDTHPALRDRVVAASGATGDPLELKGKELVRACAALEQATSESADVERFVWQRIGDLRYSMIYLLDMPSREALLGYGPASVDPETGEIVQANAFLYGAVLDTYVARATDIVGLLNCKDQACVESYAKGVPVADWVAQAKSGTRARLYDNHQIRSMQQQMSLDWLKAGAAGLPPIDWRTLESVRTSMRKRSTAWANGKTLGLQGASASVRLEPIRGTTLEKLARNQFLQSIGLQAGGKAFPGDTGKSSLYDWAGPGMVAARRKARMHLAQRRVELATFYDSAILGLALRYKETGKTRDQIFADLKLRILKGLAEHEVGHTLGLRHNFAASYDAMNYQPGYWRLRSLGAQGKALPRYRSGLSKLELEGNAKDAAAREGLGSYQYSSVMDYGARFSSDIAGLGYYDYAAIKFGYGKLVEVFDKVSSSADDRYLLANAQTSIRWGEPMLYTVGCNSDTWRGLHYTEYPRIVGGVGNLERANRVDVPLARMTTTKLSKLAPGCKIYQEDVLWDSDVPVDDKSRFEIPFRFCSDEYEGASPECSAYDHGADMYELVDSAIERYQNYYLFHNLKLDRLGFSFWGYLDRIQSRYLEPMRSSMQFYLLIRGDLTGDTRNGTTLGDAELDAFFAADDGYGPWTVGVARSLDFLLSVLATPEVGDYWIDNDNRYDTIPLVDVASGKDLPPDLNLSVPSGKYFNSSWDFDSGYFWYDKMTNIGIFHDKYLALWTLTNPETFFLGRDTSSDLRQYSINYYRLYPEVVTRFLQGLLTDDWAATGYYASNKQIVNRDFSVMPYVPPAGANPVNPQMGYTVEFFGALLGVSMIPQTYDTGFLDSCRVWVKGSKEEITPSQTPVCFGDPFGGKSFCAMTKKVSGLQTGIGAAMIARANTLEAEYNADPTPETKLRLQQYIDLLELMRAITAQYAYTPF